MVFCLKITFECLAFLDVQIIKKIVNVISRARCRDEALNTSGRGRRLWKLIRASISKPLALRESRYLSDYAGQSSSAIQRYRSFSGEFWTMAEVGAVPKVSEL